MFGIWEQLGFLDDCATSPWLQSIISTAQQYGIDPNIAVAQFQQESGCGPNRVSPAGAAGIAQFTTPTWLQWGSANPNDRFNPSLAIDSWGSLMRDLLDTNGQDYSLALAAYNAGQGRVDYYGGVPPFAETQNYVARILGMAGASSYSSTPGPSPGSPGVDTSGVALDGSSIDPAAALVPLALIAVAVVAVVALTR